MKRFEFKQHVLDEIAALKSRLDALEEPMPPLYNLAPDPAPKKKRTKKKVAK